MEEEHWKEKRMQRTEEMSTAIQRARQRREDEEKKMENDRKAAAAEKLRLLDERSKKRDDRVSKYGSVFLICFTSVETCSNFLMLKKNICICSLLV